MVNKIEQLTQQYWRISMAFESRSEADGTITTSGATRQLGEALMQLNPDREVSRRINLLREHIITGGKPQCQVTTSSRLIPLTKV